MKIYENNIDKTNENMYPVFRIERNVFECN